MPIIVCQTYRKTTCCRGAPWVPEGARPPALDYAIGLAVKIARTAPQLKLDASKKNRFAFALVVRGRLDPVERDRVGYYPHPFSLEESRQWIERMRERYARDGFALLAVEDRATEEFLGNVGPMVQIVDGVDEIELGWSITPARSRQGIATEAALASREWVFAECPVDHVISLILPENAPSRGVAERLGMTVWKEVLWGKERPRTHLVYRVDRP